MHLVGSPSFSSASFVSTQTIVGCSVLLSFVSAAAFDLFSNSNSLSLRRRARRLANWLPMALMYALFYMTRYNIAALAASERVREEMQLTKVDLGFVVSCGFWSYAAVGIFTGRLADALGGRLSLIYSTIATAFFNIALALVLVSWNLRGQACVIVMCAFYSASFMSQGLGTAATMKIAAHWYSKNERGRFGGIFNVAVTTGYYLALGVGSEIVGHPNISWKWLFALPGICLSIVAIILFVSVRNKPSWDVDADVEESRCILSAATSSSYGSASSKDDTCDGVYCKERPKISKKHSASPLYDLVSDPIFASYALASFCMGWLRDGFVTLVTMFMLVHDDGGDKRNSTDAFVGTLSGGALTMGGIVGGLVVGEISDRFFEASRASPLLICVALQALLLTCLFDNGVHDATRSVESDATEEKNIEVSSLLLFFFSVFMLGSYSIINYSIPADLGASKAGLAAGVFSTVQYTASGLSSFALAWAISAGRGGWNHWYTLLLLAVFGEGVAVISAWYWAKQRRRGR